MNVGEQADGGHRTAAREAARAQAELAADAASHVAAEGAAPTGAADPAQPRGEAAADTGGGRVRIEVQEREADVERPPVEALDPASPGEGDDDAMSAASLLRAAPGIARIAASAVVRTGVWSVGASARTSARLVHSAISGEPPVELFQRTGADLRRQVRRLLEIVDPPPPDEAPGAERPQPAAGEQAGRRQQASEATVAALRARGAELLRRSADVNLDESEHPAYARIVDQLAPDEARILRLLMLSGPQPAVDVRAGLPMSTQLVKPGLNMIGAEAGCRYLDRVPVYLSNLHRLGLVWFSREPLKDHLRYQVLEAQPEVAQALKRGRRTSKTIRRSILLTPFGKDFCETVLPLDTAEMEKLSGPVSGEEADTARADRPQA